MKRIVVAAGAAALTLGLVSPPAQASAPAVSPAPPPITVTIDHTHGRSARGHIFVAPYGDGAYASGAELLSPDGKRVVWFRPAAKGTTIADFRSQTYRGKRVLTFWQGKGLGGLATGANYVYDENYRHIATVRAGNGYSADGHEFLIAPDDTALILAYTKATADLRGIGGRKNQAVINGVVQRVDIRTGKVLWQWNSADHVPYAQSEQPLPADAATPWDWFHVNAIKVDADGNYLIDARDTWTAYKVNRHSGKIIWRLGGKANSFRLRTAAGETLNDARRFFAWQHDAEGHGRGVYTVFDNEAAGTANTGAGVSSELAYSRAVTIKIDERRRTATLLHSDDQPRAGLASSQGNAQRVRGGGLFVGWGALPQFSQFDASGRLVFDATYPEGYISYRAYRLPWREQRE